MNYHEYKSYGSFTYQLVGDILLDHLQEGEGQHKPHPLPYSGWDHLCCIQVQLAEEVLKCGKIARNNPDRYTFQYIPWGMGGGYPYWAGGPGGGPGGGWAYW